jgi:hypothetical protein
MAEKAGIAAKTTQSRGKESASKKAKANLPQSETLSSDTPVEQLLFLQRNFGNRAVTGFMQPRIQAKLKMGKAGDKYELEADRMADRVMRQEDEEKKDVQTKSRKRTEDKEEKIQTQSISPTPDDKNQPAVSSRFESRLSGAKGGGQPLPEDTREFMETRFDADFSSVRIHTGSDAAQMSKEVNAQAFTSGKDIYFGPGGYNTVTTAGKRLLAHELTHVVQQDSEAVIRRNSRSLWNRFSDAVSSVGNVIGSGAAAVRRFVSGRLRRIPGYRLLGVVMERDLLTGDRIVRNGRNFIDAGLDVIPNGREYKRKLQREGALDEAAAWLDEQLNQLNFNTGEIADRFRQFMAGLGIGSLAEPGNVIRRLQAIIQPPIARLIRFARNVARQLLRIVKRYLIRSLIGFIRRRTRAYPLVTMILGRDPISDRVVRRTPIGMLRAFMVLSENGAQQLQQMQRTGTLQRAAAWVNRSIARLARNLRRIRSGFLSLWRRVGIGSLMSPAATFQEIYDTFAEPVGDTLAFVGEVAVMVLRFIKNALLRRLSAYARTVRGFPLVTVILGRDPFTGETVPRTATNFVRGFLSLLSDGEEQFRNLQRSGALERAFAWLGEEVNRLNLTWENITTLFRTAWDSFSIRDLANPPAAFLRIVNLFRAPVGRIIRFAAAVGMKILEFVFEGVMGAGGARVLNILKRGRDTFMTIIRDPVAFLGHLIDSVKLGFQQFARNILRHLQAGLFGWLFGAMQGAGIQMPERLNLRGIISLVLQILGLTYDRIRPRLVRLLGERTVSALERSFEFLRQLVTEGPVAAWRKIVEFAGNLRDRVIDGIKNFVITRIVQAAVIRIASMFNPAGAVVQSILAIYNTVMFFIERINQILAVVESVINSIANIAAGNIRAAANYVEQTMARTIPVIISFLARLMGLGNIAGSIRRIIQRIRRPIDRAIDRVVNWIARRGRAMAGRGRAAVRRGVRSLRSLIFPTRRFRAGRETHTIEAVRAGRGHDIIIHSQRMNVRQFISYARERAGSNTGITGRLSEIESAYTGWRGMPHDTEAQSQQKGRVYQAILQKIERVWKQLPSEDRIPVSRIRWLPLSNGRATGVTANPLTVKGVSGSPPRETIRGYDRDFEHNGVRVAAIRAHLLHHRLHGPGRRFNLTPTSNSYNRLMYHGVERQALEASGIIPRNREKQLNTKLDYRVTVTYQEHPSRPELKDIAKKIIVVAKALDMQGNEKQRWTFGQSQDNW